MIVCRDCGREAEPARPNRRVCLTCYRRRDRERYAANAGARRSGRRAYYARNREKALEYNERYRRDHPYDAQSRRLRTLADRGLSPKQYAEMEARQEGRCELCLSARPLVIDHDHVSGDVRGLLCDPCNRGLGLLEDDPATLLRAVAYIQEARRSYLRRVAL